MKKWMICFCLIFLVSCSQMVIDWVDFIQFRGNHFVSKEFVELSDLNFIGDNIGEVKRKLHDQVRNPNYRSNNGDAAYLEPGTKLYSVINHPHLIAVKDSTKVNGYKLYEKENQISKTEVPTFSSKTIIKIEVYEEVQPNQYLFNRQINIPQEITKLSNLFLSAKTDSELARDWNDPDMKSYIILLYSSSPMAGSYQVYFDGNQYFWHNEKIELLPKEIEKHILPTNEKRVELPM